MTTVVTIELKPSAQICWIFYSDMASSKFESMYLEFYYCWKAGNQISDQCY